MKKVLVVQDIHEEGIKLLEKEVKVVMASNINKETLIKESKDCDGILVRTAELPGELIKGAKRLKVIGRHGIGTDNIDVKTATEQGVLVVNVPTAMVDSVAEHVLTMMLVLSKNIIKFDYEIRRGGFELRNKLFNTEIKGKTVGIIGLGNIGICLAGKLQGLEVNILAYDPFANLANIKKGEIELVNDLDEIYKNADFITVHVPLNNDTRGMIGKEEFEKMKKSAYFINASRGPVVREDELYQALKNKKIAGAGIDVYNKEPLAFDNPLFKLNNVVLTPHNASHTKQVMIKMATQAAQGILDFLNGKTPKYMVNPEVLEKYK